MWIIAGLALLVGAFVLVLVMLLAGAIVPPLYDVVVNDPAVKEMGYDTGVEVSTHIGLEYVLPLIGLSLVIWFLVYRLASDVFMGNTNRR